MRAGSLTLFLTLVMLVSAPPALAAQDRIDLKQGRPLVGKVLSEDYRQVRIKTRKGKERSIPTDLILDVVRADAPDAYASGRASLQNGEFLVAVSQLRQAEVEGKTTWVKEYAAFFRAEALRSRAEYPAAISAYEKTLQYNPKSRLLPLVRLRIARAQVSAGRAADAAKTLDAFSKEVQTKSLPESFGLQARMLLGRMRQKQGAPGQAAVDFEAVVRAAERLLAKAKGDSDQARFRGLVLDARRDLGAAYTAAKKYSQAEACYAKIRSQWGQVLRAQAVVDIGKAELALARGQTDSARVQLTGVLATYYAVESERPRAVWLLARCYEELDAKGERGARKQARTYLRYLVEHFPGSDQAADARKQLKQ